MNNETLNNNKYIQELLQLEKTFPDRRNFHDYVRPLLVRMGKDKEFLREVVRRNFDDPGYTSQQWSMYNIPYFLVFETDDLVLKIHLFPRSEQFKEGQAAHAIHHHNNYLLTTFAFFGSGYETFLFDKTISELDSGKYGLRVNAHFHQRDWNPSLVDAWEPHIVFVPESFSATLLVWTPDKKRSTDTLRSNSVLKALKKPLRKVIQLFGMEDRFGIARQNTLQYYPSPAGKGFDGIKEEDYFAPSKAEMGPEVNDYCMQMIFSFLQQNDLVDTDYFKQLLEKKTLPVYFLKWMEKVANGETVEEVFHRKEINVPQRNYSLNDILQASGQQLTEIKEVRN